MSRANAASLSPRRAIRTSRCPLRAKTRAISMPMPAEAPVRMTTGSGPAMDQPVHLTASSCIVMCLALSRNGAPQFDTVARGHAKQIRGAPDNIVFELVHSAVGKDDLPHHLDNAAATFLVQRTV